MVRFINLWLACSFVFLIVFQTCGGDSYNCHGYAWLDEPRWIDFPPLENGRQVENGPIIVHFDEDGTPIHSGKYLGYGWSLSKWGKNPLMLHPIWLSPYGWDYAFYEKR